MKIIEREKAIELRKKGLTYNEIKQHLSVSRGSLSLWLRNIPFVLSKEICDRQRLARIRNSQVLHKRKIKRVSQIMLEAKREISKIKPYELKLLGIMAYLTEGSKTEDNLVKFTNSNPKFIRFVLKWLREICAVPEEKLRFHLRIHGDLNRIEVEQYWSNLTAIPVSRFYKTTFKISSSNGRRYNKLKYGIASIIICDTNLFYKIMGWIEGIIDN